MIWYPQKYEKTGNEFSADKLKCTIIYKTFAFMARYLDPKNDLRIFGEHPDLLNGRSSCRNCTIKAKREINIRKIINS
jgi:hypothetical protein